MFNRYQNLKLIQQLEPQKDHIQIAYMLLRYEFTWDTVRYLEVALMRTCCIPSI